MWIVSANGTIDKVKLVFYFHILKTRTMKSTYPEFVHHAAELSAYIYSADTFIIALKNKEVIRFVADDADEFIAWLTYHGIRDIKHEVGSLVYDAYFNTN